MNGDNYTAAGILAALAPLLPAGGTATVAGFGGGAFNNTGFQVTFGGTLALRTSRCCSALQDLTAGRVRLRRRDRQGRRRGQQGHTVTPTGNTRRRERRRPDYTIPLRTPFALTGTATDADGDAMRYAWEQNDRGARRRARRC